MLSISLSSSHSSVGQYSSYICLSQTLRREMIHRPSISCEMQDNFPFQFLFIYIKTRLASTLIQRLPTSQPSLPYITVSRLPSDAITYIAQECCCYDHCIRIRFHLTNTAISNTAHTTTGFPIAAVTSTVLSDAADECGNAAIANIGLRCVRWNVRSLVTRYIPRN